MNVGAQNRQLPDAADQDRFVARDRNMKKYRSSVPGRKGKVKDFNRYEFSGGTSGGDKVKLMMYSRYISGVLLYFLLYSCATTEEPKFVVLTHHESFTRESTVAGKMGIGAFLSEVSDLDESRMFQYAELCRKIFLEKRRDLAIVPLYVIFGQLGRSNYNVFLDDYVGYDTFN